MWQSFIQQFHYFFLIVVPEACTHGERLVHIRRPVLILLIFNILMLWSISLHWQFCCLWSPHELKKCIILTHSRTTVKFFCAVFVLGNVWGKLPITFLKTVLVSVY